MQLFKLIALILVDVIFLLFGVWRMISTYQQDNPFSFIMNFFAASFIILVSAALLVGFCWHLVRYFKPVRNSEPPAPPEE